MEDDEYDDIADEDLIDAWDQVQAPQSEPPQSHVPTPVSKPASVQPSRAFAVHHKSPRNPFTGFTTSQAIDLDDLEGFFSDESNRAPVIQKSSVTRLGTGSSSRPQPVTFGRSQSFRQTTLLGQTVRDDDQRPPSSTSRVYVRDQPAELPTHHALDHEALKTWVYPMNLGAIRDYQFNIVSRGLFKNTLVALPTGLGKTFIAATVMLNYFRWTKTAKIIFVAPTKPLVSQQVEACLNITGIPRSEATLLTGETPPVLREGEWASKRVFFMTPQTMMNDLSKGYADPKSIALIVIDEAHKATGDYAYVKVVEFVRRFQQSFRVLALTATPGSSVEAVQAVIDNLGISHVEIRTEDSIDISKYVHSKNEEIVQLEPSEEILRVQELFGKALKPFVDKLSAQNIYWGRDPMSMTTFGLMQARQQWMKGPGAHANQGLKFSMMAVFNMLQSLAHSIKLLEFHGIKPFYDNLAEFRNESEAKGDKGSKLRRQLTSDKNFQEMLSIVEKWLKLDGFVSHPKVTCLSTRLLNHFMDAGVGSSTRAIVFCEYRDSAEDLVRVLNKHKPLISAAVFVGQSDSKRSEGMKQKQQIETIERFKSGGFNVLVATSIGEEGLDIGQVDLIVCYDASASPIRMLQRMGRTGRKRAGKVILLLMKGREEAKFAQSKDNYDKMQKMICDGERFSFRHDLSTRIVPRGVMPEVDKRNIEIPFENSQDTSLPEPKKTKAGVKKKPAKKKFNMPDGVMTGFTTASALGKALAPARKPQLPVVEKLEDIPSLDSVYLTDNQSKELSRVYKFVPYQGVDSQPVEDLDMERFPEAQRRLHRTTHLPHSAGAKRTVQLLRRMAKAKISGTEFVAPDGLYEEDDWKKLPLPSYASDDTEIEIMKIGPSSKRGAKRKTPAAFAGTSLNDALAGTDEEAPPVTKKRAAARGGRKTTATTKGKKVTKGKSRLKHKGDDLEDMGDNCERTSDISDDGSDDGADLDGWLVGDDEPFSSFPSVGSITPTGLSPSSKLSSSRSKATATAPSSVEQKKGSTFYEPMDLAMTQDSLPDLDELLSSTKAKKTQPRQEEYDMSDEDFDAMEAEAMVDTAVTKATKPQPIPGEYNLSDDDFDALEAAVQEDTTRAKRKPSPVEMDEDEDDEGEEVVEAVRKSVPNKRRRVIADSEDDDDDEF